MLFIFYKGKCTVLPGIQACSSMQWPFHTKLSAFVQYLYKTTCSVTINYIINNGDSCGSITAKYEIWWKNKRRLLVSITPIRTVKDWSFIFCKKIKVTLSQYYTIMRSILWKSFIMSFLLIIKKIRLFLVFMNSKLKLLIKIWMFSLLNF